MNMSSPGGEIDGITDSEKERRSASERALDLNSPSDRKASADGNDYQSEGTNDFQVEVRNLDLHAFRSQDADMKGDDMESPCENPYSHMQTAHENFVKEKHQEDYKDRLKQLCENDRCPEQMFDLKIHDATFHAYVVNGTEDTLRLQESYLGVDANELERLDLENRFTSVVHDEDASTFHSDNLQALLPKDPYKKIGNASSKHFRNQCSSLSPSRGADGAEKENVNHSTKSFAEEGQLNEPVSGQHSHQRLHEDPSSDSTFRQKSVTPLKFDDELLSVHGKKSSSLHHSGHDQLYSPKSHKRKHYSSPQRFDLEDCAHDHVYPPKDTKAAKRSQRRDSPPLRRESSSARRSHRYGKKERSLSQSPVRRRHSSSRFGRDCHDKPRSRSPSRHLHIRSRRYSPRRQSPSRHLVRCRSPRRRPWSPPPNRSTGLGKPGRDLFVAGFEFLTTEEDLERKFSRFGQVLNVRIVRDKRSGDSRGFAFLTMERDEEADAAIRALDETEWNGRIILVEKSKT